MVNVAANKWFNNNKNKSFIILKKKISRKMSSDLYLVVQFKSQNSFTVVADPLNKLTCHLVDTLTIFIFLCVFFILFYFVLLFLWKPFIQLMNNFFLFWIIFSSDFVVLIDIFFVYFFICIFYIFFKKIFFWFPINLYFYHLLFNSFNFFINNK